MFNLFGINLLDGGSRPPRGKDEKDNTMLYATIGGPARVDDHVVSRGLALRYYGSQDAVRRRVEATRHGRRVPPTPAAHPRAGIRPTRLAPGLRPRGPLNLAPPRGEEGRRRARSRSLAVWCARVRAGEGMAGVAWRASAEVEDQDGLSRVGGSIKPERDGSGGRLVEYPQHVDAGYPARVLRRLPLRVVEVGGDRNHHVLHARADERLGRLAHSAEDHR